MRALSIQSTSAPARKGFSNSSASAGNARATAIRAERPTNFAAGMHFSFLLPSHFPYQQSGLKSRCFDVVPNAFVLTYKPLPTGSNDQATFWLGSKLLKTVWLMGALLLIAALNSAHSIAKSASNLCSLFCTHTGPLSRPRNLSRLRASHTPPTMNSRLPPPTVAL